MKWLTRFLKEEHAATATEYAVMLALILIVIIGAISSVGGGAAGWWGNIGGQMGKHGM